MRYIEKVWFRPPWLTQPLCWLLLPLTVIFWAISRTRFWAYQKGIFKRNKVAVPVVVVGNISVGGNGKTPLVIRLASLLRQHGYHPGIVSRGYGGKHAAYPLVVKKDSDPAMVGDEPVLMRQHLACPLVVDPVRARGAQHLIEQFKCDVIICDDGLQHYALGRDIEIAVVDGQRRHGNACLLPMGPLREPTTRLKHVDFVVVNGGSPQGGENLMTLEPGKLVNVKYANKTLAMSELNRPATAIAGIGNPSRFFDLLKSKQIRLKNCVSFGDHHPFSKEDIPSGTVLMTEKDAVKCRTFAEQDWWYLPVNAKLSSQFEETIIARIKASVHRNKHTKSD
ncbi:tetraacyldisaccharide 4'-kinase [Aestuariibacter sp. AA17]|uniref:Tetraacyldisaccharide 4'-kinase n=1 Tax=Fluctibacter corallii TaxID=2984329 RepID=A0ABT3A5I8_9ALTE|nr:tetraacyldisaccharide 4'-kinase [Aestuariibacter sp. AA17]MCV2883909.1 tetraacyldisaccharide 4'-kinase [Aestuariibacter sp. AA17]